MENEPDTVVSASAKRESAENHVAPSKHTAPATLSAWASVVSALVALLALLGTVGIAGLNIKAAQDSELRNSRVKAYSDYIGDLATFNQLMWANIYWSGTDRPDTDDKRVAKAAYWETILPLQSRLEADYSVATMLALGSETEETLITIHLEQQAMVKRFACMAEAQTTECEDQTRGGATIPPASNAVIVDAVGEWSDSYGAATAALIKIAAATQVQ